MYWIDIVYAHDACLPKQLSQNRALVRHDPSSVAQSRTERGQTEHVDLGSNSTAPRGLIQLREASDDEDDIEYSGRSKRVRSSSTPDEVATPLRALSLDYEERGQVCRSCGCGYAAEPISSRRVRGTGTNVLSVPIRAKILGKLSNPLCPGDHIGMG